MEVRAGDKRVLLADDEESVRESLGWLLKFDHHEVVSAASGQEAFACFERDCFDLVITDYSMPGMNGDELAVQIKRIRPSQPILMITAYTHTTPGLRNPVDAILTKPFAINDFRNIVRMLVSCPGVATGNGHSGYARERPTAPEPPHA